MSEIALLVVSAGAVISSFVLLTKKISRCVCCRGLCSCDQDTTRLDSPGPEAAIEQQLENLREVQNIQKPIGIGRNGVSPIAFMPRDATPRPAGRGNASPAPQKPKARRSSSHL